LIRSMTGFARTRGENEAYAADVEIRSVNYRYLDVRVRVPTSVSSLETRIRERVQARAERGKVDVNIYLRPKGESAYELEVDRPLVEEIVQSAKNLGADLGLGGEISLADLMSFGRGFNVKEKDLSGAESVWEALEPALEEAIAKFDRMRQDEGNGLKVDLEGRLSTMESHIDTIEDVSASSREKKRQDLLEKIKELEANNLEPSALAMEVARLVERSDVTEELTRFRSHLSLWREAAATDGPCGKKLDFIIQAMNPEINTIGSFCRPPPGRGKRLCYKESSILSMKSSFRSPIPRGPSVWPKKTESTITSSQRKHSRTRLKRETSWNGPKFTEISTGRGVPRLKRFAPKVVTSYSTWTFREPTKFDGPNTMRYPCSCFRPRFRCSRGVCVDVVPTSPGTSRFDSRQPERRSIAIENTTTLSSTKISTVPRSS